MGKWKCIWCFKVLEGESFMDLVMAYTNNNEAPHAWKSITLVDVEAHRVDKLLA